MSFVMAVSDYHANHHRSPAASDADDGEPEALVCAIPWMSPERAHFRPFRTGRYRGPLISAAVIHARGQRRRPAKPIEATKFPCAGPLSSPRAASACVPACARGEWLQTSGGCAVPKAAGPEFHIVADTHDTPAWTAWTWGICTSSPRNTRRPRPPRRSAVHSVAEGQGGNEMAAKRKATRPRARPTKATMRAPRRSQAPEAVDDVSTRGVLEGSMKSLVRERFLKRLHG